MFGRLKKLRLKTRSAEAKQRPGLGTAVGQLDDRTRKILVIILMIIMVFMTFMLVDRLFGGRCVELITGNTDLKTQISQYREMIANQEQTISETDELNLETNDILYQFGAGNTPEKTLLFLNKLSAASGMNIPSVDFGQETLVDTSGTGDGVVEDVSEAVDDTTDSVMADQVAGQDQIDSLEGNTDTSTTGTTGDGNTTASVSTQHYLYVYTVSFSYSVSYGGLKTALKYIANYDERMSLASYNSTWNEATQTVTGSMVLNMYTLTGTEKQYLSPAMSGVALGKSNIFV